MLNPGELLPCDIWLRAEGGSPVLYRHKNLPFTADHFERLRNSGVETLWIAFDDAAGWNQYTENHLRARVNDPSIPVEQRVEILIQASRPIMKAILDNPRAPGTRERVGRVADAVCDLVRGPEAVAATVRLMEHDYYTYTHSLQVAIFSVALARSSGFEDPVTLASIGRGSLMHDCGKCTLPAFLLNKRGRLDNEEWELMMTHPGRGVEVLAETEWTDPVVFEITLNHHERGDGSGYPRRLTAKSIPRVAKVVAIADAFDAMTSDRAYQRAMRGVEALHIIHKSESLRYDQNLVETFIRLLLAG